MNAMRRVRIIIIAAPLILLVAAMVWWLTRSREPALAILPVGRTLQHDGTTKFLVAITNNSGSTLHCVTGRTQIFTQGDGQRTTNFMEMKSGQLAPGVGAHFVFDVPTNQPPWTLSVAYMPMLSQSALRFRALGARLGLWQFATDFQFAETIQIEK
jgi:hypothetical protein